MSSDVRALTGGSIQPQFPDTCIVASDDHGESLAQAMKVVVCIPAAIWASLSHTIPLER